MSGLQGGSGVLGTVKPFDGTGFSNWEFRLRLLLEKEGVLDMLTENPPDSTATQEEKEKFRKADVKARNLIVWCLSDNVLEMVKGKQTAKEIMHEIKGTYQKQGIANLVQLQKKLRNLKYNGKSSLNEFIIEFEKTVTELKTCGGTIDNNEVITQLLSAMPETYQSVTTAIDILFCQNVSTVTLDFVKSKLLMEESRQLRNKDQEAGTSSAFVSQRKFGNKNAEKQENFPYKCHKCKEVGHKIRFCPQWKNNGKRKNGKRCNVTEEEQEIAFVAGTSKKEEKVALQTLEKEILFVIDSGATNHLVNQVIGRNMINVKNVNHKIGIAKVGEAVIAKRQGDLLVETEDGRKFTLENVLECESLSYNLMSVRKMEEKGLLVSFSNRKVKIEKQGIILATGELNNSLYKLKLKLRTDSSKANLIEVDKNLMHRRMGHSSTYPCEGVCEVCLKGKQARFPHNSIEEERKAKHLLEIVSSDVCGPISPTSQDGKKYFVTFIDHFSHFTVCYFMETKDEVFEHFKTYLAMIENKFNKRMERLRLDNGGEYISSEFKTLCREKGIQIEYTIPRTPQHNGVAERYNRTVMEKARCLIFDSTLTKEYWKEAVCTSVYLLNRTKTTSVKDGRTPAEIWYNTKPNIEKIRVFGCKAYVHIPKEDRNGKLDSRSKPMIMVGYTNNGYRLWDTEKEKIVVARNVVFDESLKPTEVIEIRLDTENEEQPLNDETSENLQQENFKSCKESEDKEKENSKRPQRKRQPPLRFEDYDTELIAALSAGAMSGEIPENYETALEKGWKKAINEELQAVEENKTWKLVPRPANKEVIDSKWVFSLKERNGVNIKKARLVARGFKQKHIEEEIYSPVACMMSIRVLLALSVKMELLIHQMDVKCAFLNGELKEPVFMEPPEGLENVPDGYVCELRKALYGLRQSPKCWYDKLNEHLVSIGFARSLSDPCLYFDKENTFLLIHVDDLILISASEQKLNEIKEKLLVKFKMRDLTSKGKLKFLGLDIVFTERGIFVHQKKLIDKILGTFNMSDSRPSSIPMQPNSFLSYSEKIDEIYPFKQLIGYLMYLMLGSRADLSFCVTYYSQFQKCYNKTHWESLKNVLRYLKATRFFGLMFYKSEISKNMSEQVILKAFVDSDFGSNPIDRKSISGYTIKLFDNVIFWKTKKQVTVSLSSSESEYVALSACVSECIFVGQLLTEILNVPVFPVYVYEDNQSCIKMASTLETKRTKHIDIKHHFVRDCVSQGLISLNYVPSAEQIADILTKPLSKIKFNYFCEKLNIISL